jgi:hypothetical protein
MVNEEIVGGLKNALEHGDNIKNAMMSFFNAGYEKNEIEESARIVLTDLRNDTLTSSTLVKNKKDIPSKPIQKISKYEQEEIKQRKKILNKKEKKANENNLVNKSILPISPPSSPFSKDKKVSSSDTNIQNKMSAKEKTVIAILIVLLLLLVGFLVAVFLFRQQLIDLISSLVT